MTSRNFGLRNQSLLLEDFHRKRCPNLQLADILRHVVEFAKDREGSKFIQRKLDDATDNRKASIYREFRPHLTDLITNAYANFVVQKIFTIGNEAQKQDIINITAVNFIMFSMDKYGCRVVQTIIERSQLQQRFIFLQSVVQQDMNLLIRNRNGNHVVQKIFQLGSAIITDFLFQSIVANNPIQELCKNLYACRVFQCILVHGTPEQKDRIMAAIYPHIMILSTHCHGNYIISHALHYCTNTSQLIAFILKNVVALSLQKYSSNVVEKCLDIASEQMREYAFTIICSRNRNDLKALCMDEYANYIIQKFIQLGNIELVKCVYDRLHPVSHDIRERVWGRKIIDLFKQRIKQSQDISELLKFF